ncbi:MAG: DnaJ C-terminal domain-containing protein, partial [Chitinophagales bacterium]
DLIVLIEETNHEHFVRDEQHLLYNLRLNFADAALGTSVEIPTITGKAKVKIAAGTQSGKILRLRGKGMPSVNGYGKGDQMVYVSLYTPTDISKEEKELLEKLRESDNFQPKATASDKSFFDNVKDFFS